MRNGQMVGVDELVAAAVAARVDASKKRLAAARTEALREAARMGLVLHGGAALHHMVGAYAPGESYDVDAFSRKRPIGAAHAIAAALSRRGIAGARVVPAKHKGTVSVRIGHDVVADVSAIPRGCSGLVVSDAGWALVSPVYLKMSMHLELSRPAVYIERWPKVVRRLSSLYRAHPTCDDLSYAETPVLAGEAEDAGVRGHALGMGMVMVGRSAVKALTGVDILSSWPADFVLADSDNDAAVDRLCEATGLRKEPAPPLLAADSVHSLSGADGTAARVFSVRTEVCRCSDDEGLALGSSDLVLSLLYSEYIASPEKRGALAMAIDAVVAAQERHAGSSAGPHARFSPFNPPRR